MATPTTRKKKAEATPMKMSETVKTLEDIFDTLNVIYFEGKLPKPVITVQSTPKAFGHCTTKKIWRSETEAMYEINIGAEYINRPMNQTCATLLHEMIHLFCAENGLADTCQNGHYHNKLFKSLAEARDLQVEYNRSVGYSLTSPTANFDSKLFEAGIDMNLHFARITLAQRPAIERVKSHKYYCMICGQEVRTTAELSLICGICETPMDRQD